MNIKSGLFYLSIILLFAACQKDYNDPGTGPSQYYGTRSGVSIRAILLAQMPATDPSGNNWDVADSVDTAGRADIFYRFKDIDSIDYPEFVQSFHFDNVNPDSLPLPYFLTTPYPLRAIGSNVQFDIYDFEKSISSPASGSGFPWQLPPGCWRSSSGPWTRRSCCCPKPSVRSICSASIFRASA